MSTEQAPPLSVLVVEDRDDVAESTAELLALCGHAVRIARCGADALAQAAQAPPDVVLVDIGLPDMDGWDVARTLRTRAMDRQPIVVAVTGRTAPSDRWASAEAGIDLHLVKPADPKALMGLLDHIRDTLASHRSRTASGA